MPGIQYEEYITKIKIVHIDPYVTKNHIKCYNNWIVYYKNKHNTEISAVPILIIAFWIHTNIVIRHDIKTVVIYLIYILNYEIQ